MAIEKPNILLIVADDLGVDVVRINDAWDILEVRRPGKTENERYRLLNLQRLVTNGVHFTRAWAHPVCAPTRGTLFSGLNPWRTGVGDAAGDPLLPTKLPSDGKTDLKTLANFVSAAGYECGIFGKWDLGGDKTTYVPTVRGWHRHEGILGGGLRPIGQTVSEAELRQKYYTWEKVIGDAHRGIVREHIRPTDRSFAYATADQISGVRDWIKQVAGRPWWATLALLAPHDPFHIPPEGTYTIKFRDPANPTKQEMFVAMVESMDYHLGLLFDDPRPEVHNELQKTVVIFVGDNGTQDELDEVIGDDKSTVLIGGVHVPLLIADGGMMFGNNPCYLDAARLSSEDASLVHIADLYQTILDITGGSQPSYPLDSFTLMPHLKNDPKFTNRPKRLYNFAQFFTSPDADPNRYQRLGLRATISDGDYKLDYQNGAWEFRRLTFDPVSDLIDDTALINDFQHPKAQELWRALTTPGGPYYAEVDGNGQKFPPLPSQAAQPIRLISTELYTEGIDNAPMNKWPPKAGFSGLNYWLAKEMYRGKILFDLSTLPAQARISKAMLYLDTYPSVTLPSIILRVEPLLRGQRIYSDDSVNSSLGVNVQVEPDNQHFRCDVTPIVQSWLNNPASNYGFRVRLADHQAILNAYAFQSYSNHQPYLVIEGITTSKVAITEPAKTIEPVLVASKRTYEAPLPAAEPAQATVAEPLSATEPLPPLSDAEVDGAQPPDPLLDMDAFILDLNGESYQGGDVWKDSSGRDNHATKAEWCIMPELHEVVDYNGKNFKVMRFHEDSGLILPDSLDVQLPFTIMIVDRYYGDLKGRTLQSRDKNWLLGKWSGQNNCFMEGWISDEQHPATDNVFTIGTVTLGEQGPAWYLDGRLKGNLTRASAAPGRLGLGNGGLYAEVSEADIAAVLIWSRVLSDLERWQVERWLAYKYGVDLWKKA